jgi:hypothetical protein
MNMGPGRPSLVGMDGNNPHAPVFAAKCHVRQFVTTTGGCDVANTHQANRASKEFLHVYPQVESK